MNRVWEILIVILMTIMNDDEWWWRLFFGYWKCGSGDIRVSTITSKQDLEMYGLQYQGDEKCDEMWKRKEQNWKGGNTQTQTLTLWKHCRRGTREKGRKNECVYIPQPYTKNFNWNYSICLVFINTTYTYMYGTCTQVATQCGCFLVISYRAFRVLWLKSDSFSDS